ncbi:MAG: VWA domain-containing protein [Planctomycetes bacterium]|nr:VWA domain-containing protein [Planctomycetota bacterium]
MAQVERALAGAEVGASELSGAQRAQVLERASEPRVVRTSRVRVALAAAIVLACVGGPLFVVRPWRTEFEVARTELRVTIPTETLEDPGIDRFARTEPAPGTQGVDLTGFDVPLYRDTGRDNGGAPTAEAVRLLSELGYTDGGSAGAPASVELTKSKQRSEVRQRIALGVAERELKLRGLGYLSDLDDALASQQSSEEYDALVEHAFRRTLDEALSTFSIDVDTASYANVRRHLMSGALPSAGAVRVEELINYFDYAYAQPSGAAPFSVTTDVLACPWDARRQLVRIGLKGREMHRHERKDSHLVFLIDVSGSMNSPDKLPLVQRSLRLLTEQLDVRDRVSIVVYAGNEGLVLEPTSGRERGAILAAIDELQSGGSTNGGAGIRLAYKTAREHMVEGGVNRVILCTDGDFNVGTTSRDELVKLIEEERKSGVFLSVLGFGTGNLKDSSIEQLADKGNGAYAYIDSVAEARKVLVEQMSGTLETIAKDVKIQVEFNPARVQAWRQIGYENRALAHQDFADDTKDAGEIGAGHTVTALYEIVPVGVPFELPEVGELRYQTPREGAPASFGDEWLHVKLRYKAPDGEVSQLLEQPVGGAAASWSEAALDARFAAAVAAFGMKLRGSEHVRDLSYAQIEKLATETLGRDERGWRREFIDLVRRAAAIQR